MPARFVARSTVRVRTRTWLEHSHLFAVGERSGWSVDEDARHLEATARRLDYEVARAGWARFAERQTIFLTSHFEALQPRWLESSHRVGMAYLHGRPGTPGYPEFDQAFDALRGNVDRIDRVQVTHAEMHDLVLSAGVDPAHVFRIPIGIDIEHFGAGDLTLRLGAREALDVPSGAFVVGSFQKDGVGWGDGLEPKLIKGPDVLVSALELLRADVPELFVLLTGPARGYVRRELERLAIPYRHVVANGRSELARAYHALDVYVAPARQEGGPKAVLESMATGVPLVASRVGQAQDIVEDGVNGLLVGVGDAGAIAAAVLRVRDDHRLAIAMAERGRVTAEQHANEQLDGLWASLLDGFVTSR